MLNLLHYLLSLDKEKSIKKYHIESNFGKIIDLTKHLFQQKDEMKKNKIANLNKMSQILIIVNAILRENKSDGSLEKVYFYLA
jgi:hypothetical protein